MSGFKYDEFDLDDQQEQTKHQQMLIKQQQFQSNYDSIMKQEPKQENHKVQEIQLPKSNTHKQQPIVKQPSQKNITPPPKAPTKRELSKQPPIPKSVNKQQNKNKLVQQHLKLKSQLTQLAVKMDDIIERQREKRRKKLNVRSEQEDERVIQLKSELKSQEIEINKNKTAIEKLRKNLDYKYDVHKIVEKQNELKLLKQKVKELQKQKAYLQKINKEQKQAKHSQDSDLVKMGERMKSQIQQLTQRNKTHIQSINQREKQIRKLHQINITKEQKIKQIEAKLKSKKQVPQSSDLEYNISQLEQRIAQLEQKKRQSQAEGQQRLNDIMREKKRLKYEYEKKISYLQQKQKQLKINKIQYQDIVRLINTANAPKVKKQTADDNVSKTSQKRKVNKGGRQRPKIPKAQEVQITQSVVQQQQPRKQNKQVRSVKQRHQIGVGSEVADNDDEEYGNDDFEEQVKQ